VNSIDPDQLTTGLIQVDDGGRILDANRAAEDLLGATPGALHDQHLDRIAPPLAAIHRRALGIQGVLRVIESHALHPGPVVDLMVQHSGQVCLFEIQAITERMLHRERADRADREQAVTLLARSLAHELRNPLAGVRGAAQLIEQCGDAATATRHARMIQREVDRINALVSQVAEDRPPRMEAVNLHRVLDHATELVQAESGGRLLIERAFDPSIPEQWVDEGRLHQLFLNLLRNSVQAGAQGLTLSSRIELDSAIANPPARHAIRFDIDDDGMGVPEPIRDRLFLPLVTGREQGSGFGLAVVQQIARTHGGIVDFTPLDRGSRFTFRLPLNNRPPGESGNG
jgi:two-component system nitrogen regulation sensor histidine kinase GlnL